MQNFYDMITNNTLFRSFFFYKSVPLNISEGIRLKSIWSVKGQEKITIESIVSQRSPATVMSSDTWLLSFAKYLELHFSAMTYQRMPVSAASSDAKDARCDHSLHHDHYQYFGSQNVVVLFRWVHRRDHYSHFEFCLCNQLVEEYCFNAWTSYPSRTANDKQRISGRAA